MKQAEEKEKEKPNYLADVKNIVSKDTRDILMLSTKASINGGVTGLVFGLMIGYYKNKNVYVSGIIGAIIGVVATNIIIRK